MLSGHRHTETHVASSKMPSSTCLSLSQNTNFDLIYKVTILMKTIRNETSTLLSSLFKVAQSIKSYARGGKGRIQTA